MPISRGGKGKKICRTEIWQMSISRDEESKVKFTELNYCRCQYAEMKKSN